jgi:hypothetical protein
MRLSIAAAGVAALTFACMLTAQVVAPMDLEAATPLPGTWSWSRAADGSEAAFISSGGIPQLWLHCSRASRTVSIARPANAAVPFISVWTTTQTRALPASFNPAMRRSTAQLNAYDPLLDAMAFSRGRLAVALSAMPPLVAPAWPEIARVVEDCRA